MSAFPSIASPLFTGFARGSLTVNGSGIVTSWADSSGNSNTATPTLSPAYVDVPRPAFLCDRVLAQGASFAGTLASGFNSLTAVYLGRNRSQTLASDSSTARSLLTVGGNASIFMSNQVNPDSTGDELAYPPILQSGSGSASGLVVPCSRSVFGLVLDGAGATIFCNGQLYRRNVVWGTAGFNLTGLFSAGVNIGAFMLAANEIRLFGTGATATQIQAIQDYAATHPEYPVCLYPRRVIVGDGDSMTFGLGLGLGQCWPMFLDGLLAHNTPSPDSYVFNYGVPNRCLTSFAGAGTGAANCVSAVTKVFRTGAQNIAVLLLVTNDLAVLGQTGSDGNVVTLARIQTGVGTWVTAILSPGGVPILSTVPNRTGLGGGQATWAAGQIAHNAWLKANWRSLGAAALVDPAGDTFLANTSISTLDGTHWTAAGCQRFAALVYAAVDGLTNRVLDRIGLPTGSDVSGDVAAIATSSANVWDSGTHPTRTLSALPSPVPTGYGATIVQSIRTNP